MLIFDNVMFLFVLSSGRTSLSACLLIKLSKSLLCHQYRQHDACQNLDKEAVSNMSYFGAFHRMFVHFHFYITNEAACESLHDLDFRSQYLTTRCNVWILYTIIFSSTCILKCIYYFNIYITCI